MERIESEESRFMVQNHPNPFNPTTNIIFEIPADGHVQLHVYDPLGRNVESLVDEFRIAGIHSVKFGREGLSSGTYFYRLYHRGKLITGKMLLMDQVSAGRTRQGLFLFCENRAHYQL
jgi:hypothetical protein